MTRPAPGPWAAVWLMLGAAAATAANPAATEPTPDAAARWRPLGDELRYLQQRYAVPAMVVVVLDRGRAVVVRGSVLAGLQGEGDGIRGREAAPTPMRGEAEGDGIRGREAAPTPMRGAAAPTGFDADSPFRWGSISKTVTALVALEAALRSRVPLSTPVDELLDASVYRNPWAPAAPVRLAQLLELSAGLPDLTAAEFDDNEPHPLAEALARHAADRVLLWPPGLQHSYSNIAPGITAAVVERLTRSSFDAAARRLAFEPLGMSGASFDRVPGLPGGFRSDGHTPIPYWNVTFPAFGGLNASAKAMARLLEALLNGGRVDGRQAVSAGAVERMFRAEASLGARHGLAITYGAGLYGWVRDGHLFQGHGGDADGYRSRFGLLPEAGRGYLLGIDLDDAALLAELQRRTELALIADLPAAVPPPATTPAPGTFTRYAGSYYPSSARFAVASWREGRARRARVRPEGRGLRFDYRGRTQRLIPVATGRFRREGDPAVSVVFAQQDGALYLQGELGNFVRVAPGPCPDFVVAACDASAGSTLPPVD